MTSMGFLKILGILSPPNIAMKKIKLNKGKYALVDDADFEIVNQWKWHIKKGKSNFYARTDTQKDGKRWRIFMHRLIMEPPKDKQIDHINGNGLDNRRKNLRICTNSENMMNMYLHRNGYIRRDGIIAGATLHKSGKYQAQGRINGTTKYLGLFKTQKEAQLALINARNSP